MATEWDQHVAVQERHGGFDAELTDGWVAGSGVNGGYQLAVVGHAVSKTVPQTPDPLAVSAHYLSVARPGPARVQTQVLRRGSSTATVWAELGQSGDARLAVTATYGDLGALPDDVRTSATPPDLRPREECLSTDLAPAEMRAIAPLTDRFEMLFDPRCAGAFVGQPTGQGRLQAWFRLVDGREPDPLTLLMAVDALPPVTADLGMPGWAPTLELTAHVRAWPAPGWLRIANRTRNVAGGMFEEDCEVWDSADRLVAQGRQLARLPR